MVYCMADLHGEREFFLQMLEQIHFSESDIFSSGRTGGQGRAAADMTLYSVRPRLPFGARAE